jgi:hypothetical protein
MLAVGAATVESCRRRVYSRCHDVANLESKWRGEGAGQRVLRTCVGLGLQTSSLIRTRTPGHQATATISYAREQRRRCGGGHVVEDGADVGPATPSGKLLLGATSLIVWGCRHRGANRAQLFHEAR